MLDPNLLCDYPYRDNDMSALCRCWLPLRARPYSTTTPHACFGC